MDRFSLSPQMSYRCHDDLVIVVDHHRGELLRLNRAAGEILVRLDHYDTDWSADDREFIAALVERGLVQVTREGRGRDPYPDAVASPAAPPRPGGAEPQRTALIDRLNAWAADRLVPLHCQLELTYRCPLACSYCYLCSERRAAVPELATAEVTSLLDDLAQLGGLFLLLTGGEILLRPDLEAIVYHARRRRFAVTLLTSGFGLDGERMARLAAGGLDCVQISLHGPDAPLHKAMTGVAGSFDAALGALRLARDRGVRTQGAITVTRQNLEALPAMLELLAHEGVTPNVSHYVEPRRDGSLDPQALLLDEAGLRRVEELIPFGGTARLAGRGPEDRPCGAGASTVAVDPTGTVYPCHTLRIPVGSLRDHPFEKIWNESPQLSQIRALRVQDLSSCMSCEDRDYCNRCAGFAVAEGRPLTDHSPFDCLQARVVASMNTD